MTHVTLNLPLCNSQVVTADVDQIYATIFKKHNL